MGIKIRKQGKRRKLSRDSERRPKRKSTHQLGYSDTRESNQFCHAPKTPKVPDRQEYVDFNSLLRMVSRTTGYPVQRLKPLFTLFFENLKDLLLDGTAVTVYRFGTFSLCSRLRHCYSGPNLYTKGTDRRANLRVERKYVKFVPGTELGDRLKKDTIYVRVDKDRNPIGKPTRYDSKEGFRARMKVG